MKAVICQKYGSPEVLKVINVPKPVPKNNQVLVKILATTVSSGDARIRGFNVPLLPWIPFRLVMGITRPRIKILGSAFAGEVVATGQDVKIFKKGDKVFGSTEFSMGTYAQYVTIGEDGFIIKMPSKMTYEQAAATPFGGFTVMYFLKKGNIKKGQKVLIYGASGALGTTAVQLANHFGAEVTGVCSTSNIKLVKSLGAKKVIDYTKKDFTQEDIKYDVIFDTVGKSPFSKSVKSLKDNGIYLRAVHMTLSPILQGLWTNITSNKKVLAGVTDVNNDNLEYITSLYKKGKFKSVIDKTFPLEQIVKAHRYVDQGHKKGNVVITVNHGKG